MNISNKYAAKIVSEEELAKLDEELRYKVKRGMFRDTHSKIVGPAVNDILASFLESYEEVETRNREYKPREWLKEGGLRKLWQKYKGYRKEQKQKKIEKLVKVNALKETTIASVNKNVVSSHPDSSTIRAVDASGNIIAPQQMQQVVEGGVQKQQQQHPTMTQTVDGWVEDPDEDIDDEEDDGVSSHEVKQLRTNYS